MVWVIGIFIGLGAISIAIGVIRKFGIPTLALIFSCPKTSFLIILFCGIGFAVGNIFSILWAIYGAILFGLVIWTWLLSDISRDYFIATKIASYTVFNSGIGYATGDVFTFGWALFGAFMGVLLTLAIFKGNNQ